MTAPLCGSWQTHLGTEMPSGGGYIINAVSIPGSISSVNSPSLGETACRRRAAQVNAVFQVWRREATPRARTCASTVHADFRFVATPGDADFAVRRVGERAGAILPLPAPGARGCAPASVYPEVLAERFGALSLSEIRDCVAANPSICRPEIVALYQAQVALEAIAAAARPELRVETCLGGRE